MIPIRLTPREGTILAKAERLRLAIREIRDLVANADPHNAEEFDILRTLIFGVIDEVDDERN